MSPLNFLKAFPIEHAEGLWAPKMVQLEQTEGVLSMLHYVFHAIHE